jgi:hypothetical protein
MNYESIEGGAVPIKAWVRGVPVEDVARKQLVQTASLPIVWPHLACTSPFCGFGGGYEAACRTMLYAGLRLLDANGGRFDSEATDREMVTVEPGCSGAMHSACMGAVRFISTNGWPEYVRRMTRSERS